MGLLRAIHVRGLELVRFSSRRCVAMRGRMEDG